MVKRTGLWMGIILFLILTPCLIYFGAGGFGSSLCAEGDLDSDGIREEYILDGQTLTVREGAELLWQSPKDWAVDNFDLGDADNDGTVNLVITLWKAGSFGTIRPFWKTGADASYKNHLFVFKMQNNTFKPVWCSSDLDRPIISFTIRDVNDDGLEELVVEEGEYRKMLGERYVINLHGQIRTTLWQWEEWGFRMVRE
ncbi:MAG: hypothetical protein PHY90_06205 [Desulfitobacteriaceae bacterium]|nr:hypothetical protein [Desulfitobacteriaceae bacterium]